MLFAVSTIDAEETLTPLPSRSWRVMVVVAFAVSVPAATLVVSEKLASAGLARPEPPSEPVQARLTLPACQTPSADAQENAGGFLSTMFPAIGPAVVQLPALSHTWRLFVDAFA